MLETGKISARQMVLLFITSRVILAITYFPAAKQAPANQDLWLAMLGSLPLAILLVIPVLVLARKYPQQTIVEYSQTIIGKLGGKIVGLLYLWFFLQQGAIVLRQFGEFMITALMPDTPLVVFLIGLTIMAAYAVRNGLEVISRFNEMFFPFILGSFLLIFILVTKDMDMEKLTPMFDDGFVPVLSGSLNMSCRYTEFAWFAMVYPFIEDSEKIKRAVRLGILVCGFQFVLNAVMVTAVIGYPMVKNLAFPVLEVARVVSVGNFLERMESIVMVIWVLGMLIKVALFYYVFVLGSAQWLNIQDYKPLVMPSGVIMAALALLLFANLQEMFDFMQPAICTPYTLIFIFLIPIILLFIEYLKAKSLP